MEDRRTAIAILLCIIVIVIYPKLFLEEPKPANPVSSQTASPSPNTQSPVAPAQSVVAPLPGPGAIDPATGAPLPKAPTLVELNNAGLTTIVSGRIFAKISNLGARFVSFELKDYAHDLGSANRVNLVASHEGEPLPPGIIFLGETDSLINYRLKSVLPEGACAPEQCVVPADSELTLIFEGNKGQSVITKTFKFRPDSYLFEVSFSAPGLVNESQTSIEWPQYVDLAVAQQKLNLEQFTRLTDNQKIEHVPVADLAKHPPEAKASHWVGIGDKYFLAALIPSAETGSSIFGTEGDAFVARITTTGAPASFTLYAGPRKFDELELSGYSLQRAINLGFFSFLAQPLLWALKLFHGLITNWGLAIVFLTLLIKTLFLPLNQASFRSMQAMQELQPEIKALRERIKDSTQLNQEMMALYKKRGVNPMGGCFPMLIQIPVFLGLYNALYNSIELRHAPFALWIKDLSAPERLQVLGLGIPVMVLLMGASMLVQQWLTPSTGDPAQKKMMMFMTLGFTVMFIVSPFPSGLVLYWLVNNIISIIQQTYLRNDKRGSPLKATALGALAIFSFAFVLTLI